MITSPLAEPTKPPRQKQKGGRKEQVKAATSSRHCLTTPPPPSSLRPDRSSQNRKKNNNSCPRLSPPSELRWSSSTYIGANVSLPLTPVGPSCPRSPRNEARGGRGDGKSVFHCGKRDSILGPIHPNRKWTNTQKSTQKAAIVQVSFVHTLDQK